MTHLVEATQTVCQLTTKFDKYLLQFAEIPVLLRAVLMSVERALILNVKSIVKSVLLLLCECFSELLFSAPYPWNELCSSARNH